MVGDRDMQTHLKPSKFDVNFFQSLKKSNKHSITQYLVGDRERQKKKNLFKTQKQNFMQNNVIGSIE